MNWWEVPVTFCRASFLLQEMSDVLRTNSPGLPGGGAHVAATLVVILAREQRDLTRRYVELRARALHPHPGLVVPTFEAKGVDGERFVLGAPGVGRPQVLFFFTTRCPYSRTSIPSWRALHEASRGGAARFQAIGVALDSGAVVRAYAEEHRLPYPVVTLPERKLASLYRVRRVPLLVVVGDEGRVLHARVGAMESGAAVDSILRVIREDRAVATMPGRSSGPGDPASRSTAVKPLTEEL